MKRLLLSLFILSALTILPRPAYADCQALYGGGQTCTSYSFSLQKFVQVPGQSWGDFVNNLSVRAELRHSRDPPPGRRAWWCPGRSPHLVPHAARWARKRRPEHAQGPLLHFDHHASRRGRAAGQPPAVADLLLAERAAHGRGDRHFAFQHTDFATAAGVARRRRGIRRPPQRAGRRASAARGDAVRVSRMAARKARHRIHIGVRRAARYLAAGAADVCRTRMLETSLPVRLPPRRACRRARSRTGSILPSSTWVSRMARRACPSGVGKSRSMMSAPVCPMPSTMRLVLPQMCSRTGTPSARMAAISRRSAGSTNCAYSLGPIREAAASPTPIRVAPAATCARANSSSMRTVKSKSASTKGGSSKKSSIKRVEPAQIGAHRARPFHPAFDDARGAGAFRQQPHRLDAIAHASGRGRVGQAQSRQLALLVEQRAALHNRGRLVVEPLYGGAEVRGFARRVGNGRYVVEAEALRHRHLRIGQHAVVARVVAVAHAGQVGGEHHGDGHQRQRIGGFAAQFRENAFFARHACTLTTSVTTSVRQRVIAGGDALAGLGAPRTRLPPTRPRPGAAAMPGRPAAARNSSHSPWLRRRPRRGTSRPPPARLDERELAVLRPVARHLFVQVAPVVLAVLADQRFQRLVEPDGVGGSTAAGLGRAPASRWSGSTCRGCASKYAW